MRCSVFTINPITNELLIQCVNETEETWDYSDMVDDVNQQWRNVPAFLVMTGSTICDEHINTLEDM